ncbi:MAG: biopolymer transporter ExbD [Aureliella sp.]
MPIKFQCGSCKAVKAVNERLLGREIKCPDCGEPVQLPTAEQVVQVKQQKEARQRADKLQAGLQAATRRVTEKKPKRKGPTPEQRMADEERRLEAASATFAKPKAPPKEDMDMTPMVDVTFLLLIFFMVTASFSVQKSFPRPAPQDQEPSTNAVQRDPEDNPDIVRVQVDEFNAFNVITTDWDRVVGSKQDLIVALSDAHEGDSSGNQPSKLIVEAHEESIHSAVIAALDAGREANFASFEITTVEQFD